VCDELKVLEVRNWKGLSMDRKTLSEEEQFYLFMYGCETWSLSLREERLLRAFETECVGENFI
jgi:hypothetical protein